MSKKTRGIILWLSPVAVLLLLAVLGRMQIDRWETSAQQLATTGKGAIALFTELAAGLEAAEIDRVVACYADSGSVGDGGWRETVSSERDGVRLSSWQAEAPGSDREEVGRRLASFRDRFAEVESVKMKLDSVERIESPGHAVVRAILWMRGKRADGRVVESQALLRMWIDDGGEGWKIGRQELLWGQTVEGSARGFVDVAASSGLNHHSRQNPDFMTPEWEPKSFAIIKYGSAGVATVDYDGDGHYDLFFSDGASSRLYRNLGEDGFVETTAEAGLPVDVPGINVALFSDFDNDGDADLFLGTFTRESFLFANNGDGTFTDRSATAGVGGYFVTVASAADYDGDGLLDLYVGRYLDPRVDLPTTLFYTRNGQGNTLLRNTGNLTFEDVTEEAGVRDGGLTLGVAWADYDEDGDPDLYVANDFGRNALFANLGDGRFEDVSTQAGAHDFGFGMSAAFGDVDNDLDLDLYVSNVHSSQRWYGQSATLHQYLMTSVRQGTIFEDFSVYREIFSLAGSSWGDYGDRMVKGNSLLINDGEGGFADVAEESRVNPFGWYWGSGFFDYDNDGRQDIYAANGWISSRSYDDL